MRIISQKRVDYKDANYDFCTISIENSREEDYRIYIDSNGRSSLFAIYSKESIAEEVMDMLHTNKKSFFRFPEENDLETYK